MSIAARSCSTTRQSSRRRPRTSCISRWRRFNTEPTSQVDIPRLERAIEQYRPARPEIYYELARAHAKTSNFVAVMHWCEEALTTRWHLRTSAQGARRAAVKLGRLADAARALEKAVAVGQNDASARADLGNVYLQQGRVDQAEQRAATRPDDRRGTAKANNTVGLAALGRGDTRQAESYFRAALRVQPDLVEALNNLATLLAGRRAYQEAAYHFEKAIRSDPANVDARHSYGLVLALMQSYARAAGELEAAVRLAPNRAPLRVDLADVLATLGRRRRRQARVHWPRFSSILPIRRPGRAWRRCIGRIRSISATFD